MSRTTKVIAFSVPPTVAKEVESLAKRERRTKSELFCDMLRAYQRFRDERDQHEARWVTNVISEAQSDAVSTPMTVDEMLAESDRLARAAVKRAKRLGIKTDPKSLNQLVHERRKTRV